MLGDASYKTAGYAKELQAPHLLSRDDLAAQVRRFIETFNLNIINSAQIQHTQYNKSSKDWKIRFSTQAGPRTAIAKHLVLATGVGSQKPNVPQIEGKDLYKGINIHSTQFKNGKILRQQGAKVS
ncbi:Monooxygenase [Penicillium chermesinum]|uniref:Monooxygenase n=1 Tax=Penicillium chermesinum TaxID=63820 RepID=A0A9W9P7Z7_9EURO|nr:Monooxygenase [Penicillium chermesinum]KAJ5239231.1 Monooxygenase [Penicillium chermesinum]